MKIFIKCCQIMIFVGTINGISGVIGNVIRFLEKFHS